MNTESTIKSNLERLRSVCAAVTENEPMSRHTTFRIGGSADIFAEPSSEDEILALRKICAENEIPYYIVGNGSNLLVSDAGIRGAVIHIGKNFSECTAARKDGECLIYAQSGALMSAVSALAAKNAMSGFEELSGIPGTIGGAVFMNAGAYGGEIKQILSSVRYIDDAGAVREAAAEELELGYRTSMFAKNPAYVILSCVLKMQEGETDKIEEKIKEYRTRRNEKQPITFPSAGSTFKRPEGYFAGKLIQDAGLKGVSVGGAQVSELHSGFVINTGGATAADVLGLIRLVQDKVMSEFGVKLEPEVRLLGEMPYNGD